MRTGSEPGDPAAISPDAWSFIHQAIALLPASRECGIEVGNTVAHVVDPGTARGKELPNGGVGGQWFKKFDFGPTEFEVYDARPVDFFGAVGGHGEHLAIEALGGLHAANGDADMCDSGLHDWEPNTSG